MKQPTLDLKIGASEDIPDIKRMCLSFFQSSPYAGFTFDEDKVSLVIDALIQSPQGVILLLSDGETSYGMMGAALSEFPFSYELMSTELVLWIDPEARSLPNLMTLTSGYEEWAKSMGASYTHLALLQSDERVAMFYDRRGYLPTERSFLKSL